MKVEGKEAEFLQNHSLHFLEMAFKTDKRQRLADPDGHGLRKGVCGDTIEIFVNVKDGHIEEACFDCDGCINTVACANTIAHMIDGKPVEEAWKVTPEAVIEYLETLPGKENHCAELAVGALYLALSEAGKTKPGA